MAAEILVEAGVRVDLYDAMPSVGRKFLLAGKGGLNLTHAEPATAFQSRYAERGPALQPMLDAFDAPALRAWCDTLGIATFVGSSGRIFPVDMKAAPLLRAWLHRLRNAGVRFHMRHTWRGWDADGALVFDHPDGVLTCRADAVVLALGGGSWTRLGSTGAWVPRLDGRGIAVAPLQASNCGFDVGWTPHFTEKFSGDPLKSIVIHWTDSAGIAHSRAGECMISASGIEGSLVYAISATLRDQIAANGSVTIRLDLMPDKDADRVLKEVDHPRGSRSLASHLQSRVGLAGVKMGLLRELLDKQAFNDPMALAGAIKSLSLTLTAVRPIDEAISSAGGVRFEGLDAGLMTQAVPGVFCAGEMLDWEAPTGGYLLTACLGTGRHAARGALQWLDQKP